MNDEIMTIDAEQRQRDFVSSAADAGSLVGGALVHHMFERQAERSPDRVAVRAGGEALSYSKLNARAIRIARALRARGVGRGQRVGLCVERDAEMLAAVLGILKAGGAYVPLDPTFPPERLRFMAQDAELAQLVSTSALAGQFDLPRGRQLLLDADADALASQSDQRLTPDGDLDAGTEDPAYVIYTSGSTGKPKGVIVPHRAVVNFLASMALEPGLSADDVLIAVTTLSFDIAVLELQLPLAAGATVVIANRDQGFDGRALKTLLERHQATVMQATPVTWRLLLDAGWKGQADFKALVGGEALPKDLADQLIGCGVELWNMYGPTETTVWSTCARITDTSSGITIGKPIANTTVHVLDAQNDPCPIGVAGELCIGGEGVTLGYWKRPELTADHFVPDPFDTTPGATLYRTGDLARWRDDGRLEHLGRLDLQIKIRGFRIELGEIESIIADYPGVRETVAIAREDAPGDQRLVAYLVLRDNEVAIADLRLHVSRHLPSYMVPSAFVTLDALPLTPNAKIDRKALPAPQPSDFLRSDYVAPQTATEELLAGIWSEVLGLERVGTHDNFFELGGHSLLVVSVVERMRRAGLNAGAHSFYLKPTIAELAAAADNEGGFVEVPPNRIPPNCEAISPDMLSLVELSAKEIERLVAAVPGGAANVQDIYGLAPLQEGLLFHHRMTSGGDGYLTRTLYGFESRDQLDRYLQAFQKVVDRNDILRTALLWEGLSEPVQVVYRQVHLVVEEVDLSGTEGDAAQQLRARFNPRKYRLDVRQAPLIRICIAHDPANNRWLMQQMVHHLIDDQVTMNFVREEVQAHLLGQADKLPEPLPFRNFVAQSRTSVPSEAHEAFFREMLGDVDETTAPFGLTDVQGDGSEIVEALAPLDPILSRRLRQAAQAFGVSAASLFHLAFALMLARVSGREDVVFGTVLLGRMQGGEGAERMLGTCINTLPLRLQVADAGVQESVRNTHLLLAQLLRHEHAQLALAQRCSSVAANAPLFSALLNYRYGQPDGQSPDSAGRVIDGMEVLDFEERTNFPLTLCVDDLGEGFRLVAQMQSPIDPERICAYMEISLRQLVGAMEGAPTRPLSHLDVLPDDERHRLLIEWNDTERGYGDEARLHRLIERQVAKTPNSVALEFEGQTLTYAELNQRANQLARLLRRKGVRPEVLVGVFAERSFEMVLALLAVLKAGGAYVPLDPSYPAERLGHMIEDAKAPLVLAQPHLASQLPSQVEDVHLLDASWQSYAQEAGDNLEDLGTPQNLAYVIFTSGSTGRPKGAMNQHDGICNRILWMQEEYGLTSDDRVLQKTQFSFDVSTWEFYWPLITGARLVIARPDGHRDSAYLVELIQSSAVTTLHFVPSMLRVFVEEAGLEDCRSLRQVMCSGEALPHELQERFFSRLPEVELHNLYGPTEAAVDVTYWPCQKADDRLTVPIGWPVANTQMYVLDSRMQPVPTGVAGELFIGGVQVGRGYVGRDDLTAERFVLDPYGSSPDARLYKTGDLARYLADGAIEYLGRLDFQVKIRGQRIELGEIEATLDTHPGVGQSVVMAREDTPGDQRLVAYIVARQAAPTVAELKEHLTRELPTYMVPSAFVFLDAFPLTSSGKADRKQLPAPELPSSEKPYVAPSTATEEVVAGIYAHVLKLDRVGRDDDFFELGGHSLLAVSVVERMRRAGLNADVRTLFVTPTVAALAAEAGGESDLIDVPPNRIPTDCEAISPEMLPLVQLSQEEIERVVAAVPNGAANIQDIYPLVPLQEGFLFHYRMGSEGDGYLLPTQFGFDSRDRLDDYLEAMQAVVDRNDILRTAVLWEGLSEPLQVVYRWAPLVVEEIDLDPADGDVAEQLWARFNIRNFRLDVRKAPLIHLFIAHDSANGRWVMQQMAQHLVIDQVTDRIIQEEIHAYLQGQANELPAPVPFRNLVAQCKLGVPSEEHELFFRKMLGDVEEPTTPFGLCDVRCDGSRVQEGYYPVDASLAQRLRGISRALGVSAASMFHVAWALVLARVSNRDNVVFGTLLVGRMQGGEGIDRALGPCMNTLPIRIGVGDASVEEGVRHTHALLAQLIRHEHASLAVAQSSSAVAPPAPLFSALLNYRHSQLDSQSLAVVNSSEDDQNVPLWLFQDVEGREFLNFEERTNYPFELSVDDFGENFRLDARVRSPLDPQRICSYMHIALEQLVSTLESSPDLPLRSVDILPEVEREQLLVTWNETAADTTRDSCIHELFEAQASRTPDATAVVSGPEALTYRELNQRANQLAHYLRDLGIGPDARVGVAMERSIDMVVAIYGILKAGGAYVPLDPDYPGERLTFMISDARVTVLLTQEHLAARLPTTSSQQRVQVLCLDRDWPKIAVQPADNPSPLSRPENLAYAIYTSGSTGRPKGVANEHRSVLNGLLWMPQALGLDASDRVLQKTPFSFDVSVWEIFGPLNVGGQLVIAPPGSHRDSLDLLRLLVDERITTLYVVPSMLQVLLETPGIEQCGHLNRVICSGEALSRSLQDRFFELLGGVDLYNLYGPTEAAVHVSWWHCQPNSSLACVPIGKPIANTELYILDEQHRPVPVGVPGELYIGGVQVARGYLDREDLTAECFVPDPFSGRPDARLFKTGDLARYLPDGAIEYLGRLDAQVKLHGFRVELGEIEVRLTGHEDVEEAVVIADRNASGDQHLVAYVRGAAAVELDGEALRSYLQASLPPYMIPAACVAVETWPVLPSGKLNRKALPIPDVTQPSQTAYAPPRSGLERKLVQIWQKLLPVDNVGVRDDFLELGGSSMIAMKVVLAASENGISLAVGDLFRHRTIAELADRMGEYRSSVEDDESSVGTVPLTAGMRRFLYERKTPEPHHWNVCTLLEPAEPLEIGQLEEAVRHLVARHDSLRLRFCIRNGEWKAFYKEDAHRGVFSRMDLSALPPEEQLSAVERACIGIQTGFDLEMGPLLRVAYFDLGPERAHRVFVCAHHLVVDGMSLGTLVEDFGSTYHTLGGAPAPGRSRARVSYGQWAKRLERYSQSEQLQQELPFWKGLPWSACATLPRDYDCGDESNTNESARQVVVALSPGDTAALLDFLPKWAKPDDVLLAALSQALADWGGATSVLIDQISHGREPIDGGPAPSLTIGFLIAYRPLVLFVDPASTPMETVASIAKQLRQVPSAGTGFDLLRYRPGSELAELPRAEVLFNYLGSQQDIITSTGPLFRLSEDPHGSIYGPRGRRQYALSVAAAKGSDGLDVRFVYSENLHRRETVERLAAKFRERLEVVARTELRQ